MTVRQIIARTLLIGALLHLAACLPTSENPIVVPGQPAADDRLLGTWYGALGEDDEDFTLLFTKPDAEREKDHPGGMDVLMVVNSKDDSGWLWLYALAAEIDGRHYLSLEFRLDNGGEMADELPGFHIFNYDIAEDGSLQLRQIDEDMVIDVIEAGELAGTVKRGTFVKDVQITASSADLVAFLKTDGADDLFDEESGHFRRVSP
jgi:hypothetical protein